MEMEMDMDMEMEMQMEIQFKKSSDFFFPSSPVDFFTCKPINRTPISFPPSHPPPGKKFSLPAPIFFIHVFFSKCKFFVRGGFFFFFSFLFFYE